MDYLSKYRRMSSARLERFSRSSFVAISGGVDRVFARLVLAERKRKASGKCMAVLHHGPGHQSRSYCSVEGPHAKHRVIYGSYEQEATWRGWSKCTGYFDEPPEVM